MNRDFLAANPLLVLRQRAWNALLRSPVSQHSMTVYGYPLYPETQQWRRASLPQLKSSPLECHHTVTRT